MPLIRTMGPDGVANYRQEPLDPDKPVMLTGPIQGPITLADGTTYNVSDDWIEVDNHDHFGELSHHIGIRHEQEGHPSHRSRSDPLYDPLVDEFHHSCNDHCGEVARSPEEQEAAFEARLHALGHGHVVGTDAHDEALERLAELRARANGPARFEPEV